MRRFGWLWMLVATLLLAACGGGGGDGPRVLAQAQAITFAAAPALVVGDAAPVLAQASSALPVVYGSRTPQVCAVDAASGQVRALRSGTCTIEASQSGNADWAVAPAQQLTLVVQGQAQALLWAPAPALQVAGSATAAAVASSGLAVRYSSLTPALCAVEAGTGLVQALAGGTCRIQAGQAGDDIWAAVDSAQDIPVQPQAQALAWQAAPASLEIGTAVALRATASSALVVAYRSATPAVCAVAADGMVTGLAAGTCTVQADQAGTADWAPASATPLGLEVARRAQALAFAAAPSLTVGGSAIVQATASSGLPVAYASQTPGVCSVQAATGQVQGLAAGTCTVVATQAGDATWAPAAAAAQSLAVVVLPQVISFGPVPGVLVNWTAAVSASASSGLAVTYASLTPAVCRVDGRSGAVTGLAAGVCTVQASQAGGGAWAAALPASASLLVSTQPQQIRFGAGPALMAGQSAAVSASATSGLAVAFGSSTPAVCSVQTGSGQVVALAAGRCRITADQAGDGAWSTAPQAWLDIDVARDPSQAITFGPLPSLTAGSTATVQAVASSGLPVLFGSLTPAVCSVDAASGLVAGLAIGTCSIGASQAGNADWSPATPVVLSFPVALGGQTISFGAAPVLGVQGTALLQASASSGLPLRFASLTPQLCAVDATSGRVTALAAGTCTVAADQSGNTTWAAALQATQSFFIDFLTQRISFGAAPVLQANGTAVVQASASSGLAVSFSSLTPAVCGLQDSLGTVRGLTAGTCTVAASQAGDAAWAPATTAVQSFAVSLATQTLVFAAAPVLSVGVDSPITATASSGLAVAYASLTPGVCAVGGSSGLVSPLAVGSCSISASQGGNATWAAAPTALQQLVVSLRAQTITVAAVPALVAGSTGQISASATSVLALGFTSLSPAVCAVQPGSGLVSALAGGSCSIRISQAGNATWAAATPVTVSIAVALAPQAITYAAVPTLVAGSSTTLQASASSGLPLRHASLTPAVCSIGSSTGVVNGLSSGTCTVTASQEGDAVWAAAATTTLSFAVATNPVQTISFGPAPVLSLGGTATVVATASSGLGVRYTSLTPGVCSVQATSGLVTSLGLGDCRVAADQDGAGTIQPAAQVVQTLPVQVPVGVTVPAAPTGVAATLGANLQTVVVQVGAVASGGSAVTGYTVTSVPAGITASAATAPVTVTCPSSCAGHAFAIQARNALGDGAVSAAVPVLTVFDVLTTFREPDTQPRDTVFTGSFTLNSTTGTITNLAGLLTESMTGAGVGAAPYYDMTQVRLQHQLQTWRDAGLGGSFAASFSKNTTSTFSTLGGGDGWSPAAGVAIGGVYAGFPAAYGSSVQNSSVLIFVPDNPFAPLTAAQLAKLAYADCAPGGMMGAVCMTATSVAGYGAVGTMSGFPLSQVLTKR